MNEFQNAMHDFVQASTRVTEGRITTVADARELAAAGARLESVMRRMMREEAERPEWENG